MKKILPLMLVVALAGCSTSRGGPGVVGVARDASVASGRAATQLADRLVATRVDLRMESDDPPAVAERAREIVEAADGYVEQASTTDDGASWLVLRVPSTELVATLTALAALGRVEERRIIARDVTVETVDAEARLRNLIAVRDRLRGYLDRAENVAEIIEVERELARVQGEIDALEARLEFLRTQVEMAQISMRVDRPTRLGPLGLVFAGIGWVVRSLFVIR